MSGTKCHTVHVYSRLYLYMHTYNKINEKVMNLRDSGQTHEELEGEERRNDVNTIPMYEIFKKLMHTHINNPPIYKCIPSHRL